MEKEKLVLEQIAKLPPLLRHLAEKALRMVRAQQPIDPARFNDPLAQRIDWTPARPGGSSFRTCSLKERSHHRLEFSISPSGLLFGLLFVLSGLSSFFVMVVLRLPGMNELPSLARIILPVVGFLFILVGSWLIYSFAKPVVFDKELGWFWKGYRPPSLAGGEYKPKTGSPLSRIYALQILSERVHSNNNSYTSYELNLVLRDGTRINLVDHGHYQNLKRDATTLGAFLGIPIWDAEV